MRKVFIIVGLVALLGSTIAPTAGAGNFWQEPVDRSSVLTFSGPVSLPNVTLPAGSYLFRFISPINSPDVLQVMSEDGKHSYAQMHTIPIVRTNAEGNSEIVFKEHSADTPAAISAWFFEANVNGLDLGCEVIY